MGKLIRRLFIWLVLLPGALFFLFTEPAPLVEKAVQPTGADVRATRQLARQIRSATNVNAPRGAEVIVTQKQLQSGFLTVGRLVPGFRGEGRIEADIATLRASVPLPAPLPERWLNVEAAVPAFEDGFRLERFRVGNLSLPPAVAVFFGRNGVNAVFGDRAGDKILQAASNMAVEDNALRFTMDLTREERGDIMASLFGVMRGGTVELGVAIDSVFISLREAMDVGEVESEGSLQPYLVFVLRAATDPVLGIAPEDRAAVALMALTKACGEWDYAFLVGGLSGKKPAELGTWERSCDDATLRGRIDSRLHFVTSAGLRAAANRGFAVTLSEFEELSDSIGGSGFDFTDLAASNSGIRVADFFSMLPAEDWPDAIARIANEASVIVHLDGLPPKMTDAAFRARYGEIGSDSYNAVFNEIEARIDALPVYQ